MELKTTNREAIDEVPYGVYVWVNPEGEVFGDDDGNVLNVFCMKNDMRAIKALTDAAKYYGAGEGSVQWMSGKRRISDEELEMQRARERMGLVPDPLDFGAIRDEANRKKNLRND
jgi:hypothetical protein